MAEKKKASKPSEPKLYRALVGMNYPGRDGKVKRVEAGNLAKDVPEQSIGWLLKGGYIEEVEE